MEATGFFHHVIHFASWRRWGILFHNTVLESTFAFFAVALVTRASLAAFAPNFFLFLGLSVFLSSFGYLLNDAADRKRDAPYRKNVFAPYTSAGGVATAVLLVALAGNVPFVIWFSRHDNAFAALWLAWCATATLYSLPGCYLKGRGWIGLVDVTLALRTLPLLLVYKAFGAPAELITLVMLAYVTAQGLSADMAHQVNDAAEDSVNAVSTAAVRLGPDRSAAMLKNLLRLERWLLVALVISLAIRLAPGPVPSLPAIILYANVALVLGLVIYADLYVRRGMNINPHRGNYHPKDVFYLLHKSYPKLVLPVILASVLALGNPWWLLLLAPPLAAYRAFSPRRILAALHIKPAP